MENKEMRFGFGKNWEEFVKWNFSQDRVQISQNHLIDFLQLKDLRGKTFLDVGCGSGLHSLAAHRAGAEKVVSFDIDTYSFRTTQKMKEMEGNPKNWEIFQGSILDQGFFSKIEKADIVYSWGVLHHTGDMWNAVKNTAALLKPGGIFYLALYTYEAHVDPTPEFWLEIKRHYNEVGWLGKRYLELWYFFRFILKPDWKGGQNTLKRIRDYKKSRGMSMYTNLKDWLGGWPMEFAKIQDVKSFCGGTLQLSLLKEKHGEANSEYLYLKPLPKA